MRDTGLEAIERSKAAGLCDATADVDALTVPYDLEHALQTLTPGARWNVLAPSYRRNVLRWIAAARTAPTREKRVAVLAKSTANGQRLPQM